MRIAITHPTTLSRVRRGTERLVHETAIYMSQRGHDTTLISCKPGPREVIKEHGYTFDSHRRLWHPILGKLGIREEHSFVLTSLREMLRQRYDIIHAHSMGDAAAATIVRKLTGTPFVFLVNALPPVVSYYRTISTGGTVFRRAVNSADEVICISEYVRNYIEERFGRRGLLIPPPLDMNRFQLWQGPKHDPPIIFCAAALDDKRKGGRVLMRAFNIVKQHRPEVILENAGAVSAEVKHELITLVDPCWRKDVHFLNNSDWDEALPRHYGRATVSVIPSLWEAFGLVTVESMATGTPVVGTRSGALPEIINDPEIGRLFEPGEQSSFEPDNAEGLAQALCEGLVLGEDLQTRKRCRARAEEYSWDRIGPRIEELYIKVSGNR